MECLIVKKGGFLEKKEWVYDEEKKKGEYQFNKIELDTPTILFYLGEVVELEEGFIVRDWFKLIINYPLLKFLDGFMDSYLEEYKSCPESGCIDPDKKIHTIALQKIIELDNLTIINNYDCNIYMDVFGEADGTHYAIEFSPLKDYLDTPMKLIPGITFRETHKKNEKPDWGEKETVNIFYTLFDLIHSFIYEISFTGSPKQRDEKSNELNEMVERIKSGEEELIPMEEVFKEEKVD